MVFDVPRCRYIYRYSGWYSDNSALWPDTAFTSESAFSVVSVTRSYWGLGTCPIHTHSCYAAGYERTVNGLRMRETGLSYRRTRRVGQYLLESHAQGRTITFDDCVRRRRRRRRRSLSSAGSTGAGWRLGSWEVIVMRGPAIIYNAARPPAAA